MRVPMHPATQVANPPAISTVAGHSTVAFWLTAVFACILTSVSANINVVGSLFQSHLKLHPLSAEAPWLGRARGMNAASYNPRCE